MGNSNFGQIGVIPGAGNIFEWGICEVTDSHSRHCVVGIGGGMAVSADPTGVHRVNSDEMYPTAIWSRFDLTFDQAARIAQFAIHQIGKPYAYIDDFLITVERILRFRFPRRVRSWFADDGQWQCSELADMSLLAGGVDAFYPRELVGDTAPGDFEALFLRKNWATLADFTKYPIRWWGA